MQRIYNRGSLDTSREKWNEDDYEYLKRVLKKYEEIFIENKIEKNNRITRIWTENMTAEDVVNKIIEIIEHKTGIMLKKHINVPVNQSKLTNWIPDI